MYPNFMDALMPLASLPVEIAGRNRIQRKNGDKIKRWILNGKVATTLNSQRREHQSYH
jgi:hypothetical protein